LDYYVIIEHPDCIWMFFWFLGGGEIMKT